MSVRSSRPGRGCAAAAVNRELVATYWAVGERIVREEQGGAARAAYGEGVLARLGRALAQEFGRGFGERALQLMQLYLEWAKRHDRRAGEEDPIGLILCGSRSAQVVELLLSSQANRMKVA